MRETTDDREFDSRFDAAFQPGFDDALDHGFADVTRDAADAAPGAETTPPLRRPRPLVDRFVIALWAIGAVLVVGGVIGFGNAITAFNSSSYGPTPEYVLSVLFSQLAPWLIGIGLATLVGTLFLLATRWEHRP